MWSACHPIRHIPPGQILRLIVAADAHVVWSADDWAGTHKADTTRISALNVWFVDLPTEKCLDGSVIEFTFFWKEARRWEGRNYSVEVRSEIKRSPVTRKSQRGEKGTMLAKVNRDIDKP
jgi:glucoamylase